MDRSVSPPGVLDPADSSPEAREQVRIWLSLQARFAWSPEVAAAAFSQGASPEALLSRTPDARLWTIPETEAASSALARAGALLLPWSSPAYPPRLRRLVDAPPVLAVRGLTSLLSVRCVALVGARAATAPGREIAGRLAGRLSEAGLAIVSGLARGIDRAAHEGALGAGGYTVALQACGPEQVYPASHRALAARIAGTGAVVSELPLGTPPRAPHFPLRNRLISALSEAVIVVEARVRSGSLLTARHAADQGVDVFAVPGPIDAPTSRGPHQLIREGAGLVEGAADVLVALGLPAAARSDSPQPRVAHTGPERQILTLLARRPSSREELARALRLGLPDLAGPLLELELSGRVARDRDGRWRVLGPHL